MEGMFVEGAGRIATSVKMSVAECEALFNLIEVEVFSHTKDNDINNPMISACLKVYSLAKRFDLIPADLEQYIPRP